MALIILHVSRPAKPMPLPQTIYEGWCSGWLWNGLTNFRALFVPFPQFVHLLDSHPIGFLALCPIFKCSGLSFLSEHWKRGTGCYADTSYRQYQILKDEITLVLRLLTFIIWATSHQWTALCESLTVVLSSTGIKQHACVRFLEETSENEVEVCEMWVGGGRHVGD